MYTEFTSNLKSKSNRKSLKKPKLQFLSVITRSLSKMKINSTKIF